MTKPKSGIDPHFNLFWSYSGGHRKDLDHLGQMEDNVTRSFLITLSRLNQVNQNKFINKLLRQGTSKIGKDAINYDLQNIKTKKARDLVNKTEEKILLTISGIASKDEYVSKGLFSANDFKLLRSLLKKHKDENSTEDFKKRIKKRYSDNQKNGKTTPLEYPPDVVISYDELCSIHQALHDNRPDGWIYTKKFAVLIESKIGTNTHNVWQIFRHLTNSNGLNIDPEEVLKGECCTKYKLINVTWSEIRDLFFEIAKNNCFVKEFGRYLVMCDEILDLSFIVKKDEGYDHEKMKGQFPLLLTELDKRICKLSNGKLVRKKKALHGLWDYYGFKDAKGKIGNTPNYLIEFNQDAAHFSLRTPDDKQMEKILKSEQETIKSTIHNILENENRLSERYFLSLKTDRIIDWRTGVRKGETFDTLDFTIALSEIEKKIPKVKIKPIDDRIDDVLTAILSLAPFAKRFSFGLKILYPNIDRINEYNGLRKKNFNLFQEQNKFFELCTEFLTDTEDVLKLLKP